PTKAEQREAEELLVCLDLVKETRARAQHPETFLRLWTEFPSSTPSMLARIWKRYITECGLLVYGSGHDLDEVGAYAHRLGLLRYQQLTLPLIGERTLWTELDRIEHHWIAYPQRVLLRALVAEHAPSLLRDKRRKVTDIQDLPPQHPAWTHFLQQIHTFTESLLLLHAPDIETRAPLDFRMSEGGTLILVAGEPEDLFRGGWAGTEIEHGSHFRRDDKTIRFTLTPEHYQRNKALIAATQTLISCSCKNVEYDSKIRGY
ncbi:hypothetical protein EBT31_22690, partial [bacterium]|nr:hypothetical protein [bacterium]